MPKPRPKIARTRPTKEVSVMAWIEDAEQRVLLVHQAIGFEDAFFRGDSLQLRSVDGARVRAMVISMEMGKVMAMTVPVPAVHPQIARHAEMVNQPPKAMSARLETVSTMWPKRSAKAIPASHTTNAMSSVERTCPMPA